MRILLYIQCKYIDIKNIIFFININIIVWCYTRLNYRAMTMVISRLQNSK